MQSCIDLLRSGRIDPTGRPLGILASIATLAGDGEGPVLSHNSQLASVEAMRERVCALELVDLERERECTHTTTLHVTPTSIDLVGDSEYTTVLQ